MDSIEKFLKSITEAERKSIANAIDKILKGNIKNLNIAKLKSSNKIFRIKVGYFRIIYKDKNNKIIILAIKRRKEDTYKKY
ncbi:MAG: type II toxin-antitoxin system RelE/ParE family toxin [Candidatus Paceibacterota bacterium]